MALWVKAALGVVLGLALFGGGYVAGAKRAPARVAREVVTRTEPRVEVRVVREVAFQREKPWACPFSAGEALVAENAPPPAEETPPPRPAPAVAEKASPPPSYMIKAFYDVLPGEDHGRRRPWGWRNFTLGLSRRVTGPWWVEGQYRFADGGLALGVGWAF